MRCFLAHQRDGSCTRTDVAKRAKVMQLWVGQTHSRASSGLLRSICSNRQQRVAWKRLHIYELLTYEAVGRRLNCGSAFLVDLESGVPKDFLCVLNGIALAFGAVVVNHELSYVVVLG